MTDEGWELHTTADVAVELVIHDFEDRAACFSAYTALAYLYPGWVLTDEGCYGETGVFAVYQPGEVEESE